ncbi:MAG TPA: saccharopine dehydrogenase, partial [Legionella sp.]|nr:saccharopine dehydrogenase [Legionella sp.]
FKALETNASAYVNGTAAAGASLLVVKGLWDVKKMVNVEELDPDPFIELLTEMDLPTEILGD